MEQYWRRVVRRANRDTLKSLGYGDWRRIWVGPVEFVIALLLIYMISPTQMWAEWWWGLAAFAASAGVYLPLFSYNLIRTPDRLAKEQENEIFGLQDKLDDRSRQKQAVDTLSIKIETGNRLLNYEIRSEEDFEQWKSNVENWVTESTHQIGENFGQAQAVSVMSVGSVSAADMVPSYNPEHNIRKLYLKARIENFRRLLERQSTPISS